jgi:hypothetical protein
VLEGRDREVRRLGKSEYVVVDLRENEIVGCFSDLEEFAPDLAGLPVTSFDEGSKS